MNQSVTLFPQQKLIGFQEQLECITPMISFGKCALAGVVKPTVWVYVLQVLLLDLRSAWTFFRRAVLPWPPKFSSSTTTSWPYMCRVSKTSWMIIYQSNSFIYLLLMPLTAKPQPIFDIVTGFAAAFLAAGTAHRLRHQRSIFACNAGRDSHSGSAYSVLCLICSARLALPSFATPTKEREYTLFF